MIGSTLLVDADPALETAGLDVDDDLALLFLLGSPGVSLASVTTVFGNSWGAFTHLSARRTLRRAGRVDVPVVRGADGPNDAKGAGRAGDALASAARAHPGATLLALGPLTNVAAAARDPAFGANLGALVAMAGRVTDGRSDFNVRMDPVSAERVLGLPCKRTLVTFDVGLGVAITPRDVDALCADRASAVSRRRGRLRRFALAQAVWRAFRGREPGEARGGFHPWDVLAAAAVTHPGLFTLENACVAFDGRGRTRHGSSGTAVSITTGVDAGAFRELFRARISAPRQ